MLEKVEPASVIVRRIADDAEALLRAVSARLG
jgi:hypothetical protein